MSLPATTVPCAAPHIVVLGAGVIGLSTAITLLRRIPRARVSVLAARIPTDPASLYTPDYTTPFAGANWWSFSGPDDIVQQKLEASTYATFMDMLRDSQVAADAGLMRVPLIACNQHPHAPGDETRLPWMHAVVDDFRLLAPHELPEGCLHGYCHASFTVNSPQYLAFLHANVLRLGGSIYRTTVAHMHAPFDDASVSAVINCTGLGARTLRGVNDLSVYPIRGQTVLVYAPNVKTTMTICGAGATYIIPRRDGTVVLGGTFDRHNTNEVPDPDIEARIIRECVAMWPSLVQPGHATVQVVARRVGFRPGRRGGVRIEAEKKVVGARWVVEAHNYGHASYGIQTSWGSAEKIVNELIPVLREVEQLNSAKATVRSRL